MDLRYTFIIVFVCTPLCVASLLLLALGLAQVRDAWRRRFLPHGSPYAAPDVARRDGEPGTRTPGLGS